MLGGRGRDGELPDVDALRMFLASHDAACPGCGYALRGAQADVCPECGRRLVLELEREWKSKAYQRVCLGGTLAGLMFNGAWAFMYVGGLILGNYGLSYYRVVDWVTLIGSPILAVVCLVNFVSLVAGRRRAWTRRRVIWTGLASVVPVLFNGVTTASTGVAALISML